MLCVCKAEERELLLAACGHRLSFDNDNEAHNDSTSGFPLDEGTEVT